MKKQYQNRQVLCKEQQQNLMTSFLYDIETGMTITKFEKLVTLQLANYAYHIDRLFPANFSVLNDLIARNRLPSSVSLMSRPCH